MISKVYLDHYGAFSNTTFELGAVTIFSGPNESGKSTIFDALFDALTVAPGTHAKVKRNTARYGKKRKVRTEGSFPPPEITPEEFLSVLAVDSGDLSIPEGKGPWIDRLKAQLFTDGVDPAEIGRELALEASERKSARHMKELAALEEEREQLHRELQEAQARRSDMVLRRKEADAAEAERDKALRERSETGSRRKTLELRLSVLEQQWRRRQLRQAASDVAELRRVEDEIEHAHLPTEDDVRNLEATRGHLAELERKRSDSFRALSDARSRRDALASAVADGQQESATIRQHLPMAYELVRLLTRHHGPGARRRRLLFVVGGILTMLLSGAAGFFLVSDTIGFVGMASGAFAGLLLVLLSLLRKGPHLADLRDRWRAATGTALRAEGTDGMLRELSGMDSVLHHIETRLVSQQSELKALEDELRVIEGREAESAGQLEEAGGRLAGWLGHFGVSSPEEGLAAAQRRRELLQKRDILIDHLRPWKEEFAAESRETLQEELRHQLASFENLDVHSLPDEQDLPEMRLELRNLEEREEKLKTEVGRLESEIAAKRAAYSEAFSGLPERIVALERRLLAVDRRASDIERRRHGAAIAADIFDALAADSSLELAGLAGELGDVYRGVTGSSPEMTLGTIDINTATAVDAGGTVRNVSELSQGTRDVVLWTFRLALARKARPTPAILVLDDPFLSIDPQRQARCLSLLRQTVVTEGWQVVLLTKDKTLASSAEKLHSDCVHHRLERRG